MKTNSTCMRHIYIFELISRLNVNQANLETFLPTEKFTFTRNFSVFWWWNV